MTELGELVLVALADQGYGLVIDEHEVRALTPDGRRLHIFPAEIFNRNARLYVNTLRIVIAGLQYLEGFVPPAGWDD